MKEREKPEREPTDVELKFLRCFQKLKRELGRAPQLDELAMALKYTRRSGAKDVADRCVRQGWLKPREIIPMALTRKGKRWLNVR